MAAECGSFLLEARLCKGCGICTALCPRHAPGTATGRGRPVFARPEDCVLCRTVRTALPGLRPADRGVARMSEQRILTGNEACTLGGA